MLPPIMALPPFVVFTLAALIGAVLGAGTLFLLLNASRLWYRKQVSTRLDGYYFSYAEAIIGFITDVESARESLVVSCESCQLERPLEQDLVKKLLDGIREAYKRGVSIQLITEKNPPPLLQELARDGVITVERRKKVSFTGRIIDGRVLEHHLRGTPYQRGPYLRIPLATHTSAQPAPV